MLHWSTCGVCVAWIFTERLVGSVDSQQQIIAVVDEDICTKIEGRDVAPMTFIGNKKSKTSLAHIALCVHRQHRKQ